MGAWGTGILQNDESTDVWTEFKELYNKGLTPKEIRIKLEKSYKPEKDTEYYSEIWSGLAYGQWMCGEIENYTLKKLKAATQLKWLTLWTEDKDLLQKRRKALTDFIDKIRTPKATPLKRKKIVVRHAFFKTGDVIGIRVNDTHFVAAIVTRHQDFKTDGENTIVFTDFFFSEKGTVKDVLKANILYLDIGGPANYYRGYYKAIFDARNMAKQIGKAFLIGKIDSKEFLWLSSGTPIGNWSKIEEVIAEQLNFLKRKKSDRPINVTVKQFMKRNDKLEMMLIEWGKKIFREKLKS